MNQGLDYKPIYFIFTLILFSNIQMFVIIWNI